MVLMTTSSLAYTIIVIKTFGRLIAIPSSYVDLPAAPNYYDYSGTLYGMS